jgi:hypothetical protein
MITAAAIAITISSTTATMSDMDLLDLMGPLWWKDRRWGPFILISQAATSKLHRAANRLIPVYALKKDEGFKGLRPFNACQPCQATAKIYS